jgi:purine nucleoside permease
MRACASRAAPGAHPLLRAALLAAHLAAALVAAPGLALSAPAVDSAAARQATDTIAPHVMVVNFFGLEAAPWLTALRPTVNVEIPGLPAESPAVRCNADAICQMTTGMGHANAAASMTALIYSRVFDLRKTYFLLAGIAGINPDRGTIGSAAWARYAVDGGIAHEIDAREKPAAWADGYFGVMTSSQGKKPAFDYGSEVFQLDEALLQRAVLLSASVTLEDSDDVRAYRKLYVRGPAKQPPRVIQCDTLSADTWWAGAHLGERARRWTRLLTDGRGDYCTTQQEDNAVLTAMARGAHSELIDFSRIAVLRSGSDFDRPYPQQSVLDSLRAQRSISGAARIAAANLVRAGMPLVASIAENWPAWRLAVPSANAGGPTLRPQR